MSKYEVTTEVTIAVRIKVMVEADDASSAIDAAVDLLPASYATEKGKGWKADVTLKAPKGVTLVGKPQAYHIAAATGQDKAKKVSA